MVIKLRDNGVLKTYQVATSSDLFQKLDTPDTTGTSGQILGLNSNLETEWVDKPTVPTVISAFTNDAGFITNTVSNLANYYTTANTYSKTEVNNLISQIPKMDIEVVSSLPTTDISTETIYLLSGGAETGNLYEEYLYVNNAWEKLGAQSITIPTPDWEASSGESGYVANRTHYKEITNRTTIFEDMAFTTSTQSRYDANYVNLVEGDTYIITVDGVDYIDIVYKTTNAKYPALGNAYKFDNSPTRDFPFFIVCYAQETGSYYYYGADSACTVTLTKLDVIYHKLNNVYLNGKLIGYGTGLYAETFNNSNTASAEYSHAEGYLTTVSGSYGHAEGVGTQALGASSHAEGNTTTANSSSAHAEGAQTTASGAVSHAEGYYTTASGTYSHSEGRYTIAKNLSQHVFGEYNIQDTSTSTPSQRGNYVEIVGNGTGTSTRSNARTLDWSGNMWCAGTVSAGTTASPAAVTNDNDLTTKAYVDGLVGDIETLLAGI